MLIRSGHRATLGDDIPFLKTDGIQSFNRIITNEMAEASANHHVHGEIMRSSDPAEVRITRAVGRGGGQKWEAALNAGLPRKKEIGSGSGGHSSEALAWCAELKGEEDSCIWTYRYSLRIAITNRYVVRTLGQTLCYAHLPT